MSDLPGVLRRLNEDPLAIKHADIERYTDQSDYKGVCVHDDCTGLLLVRRDMKSGQLQADDRCTLCSQRYIYTDIKQMRKDLG